MLGPCRHCGNLVGDVERDPFCCHGCAAAHALIVEGGLERCYTLADAPLPTGRDGPSDRAWLAGVIDKAGPGGTLTLDVQGITCAACVWVIEKLADRQEVACRVNPGVGRVEVRAGSGRQLDAFLDDVERLGYRLGPPQKRADAAADDLLIRTGLCAALAMNAMIFAFSRYFGLTAVGADADVAHWFRIGEGVVATASVVIGGSWFIKSAGRALVRGIIHLDLPIALGVTFAYGGSVLSALLASPDQAYFDTVSMFVALMLLGRLAQRRLLAHSRLMLLADEGLDGLVVKKLVDGAVRTIAAGALRAGDRLLIVPRELVPVAARMVDAGADDGTPFSLAWISGEADPRTFQTGELLPAGAHHAGTRAAVVEATEDMASSSLHALLAAHVSDDPDASPFWRRYATFSVLAVLTLAAAAFMAWFHAGPVRALEVTTAVLVVTCPCAIGLAVPLAAELAAARLRRRGVYVRRPGFLDRLMLVRHVVLDKTGTVTVAELRVDATAHAELASMSSADRQALYDLCARSAHPKSRAVTAALLALDPGLRLTAGIVVDEVAGRGMIAPALDAAFADDTFTRHATAAGARGVKLSFVEVLQRDAAAEVRALKADGFDVHLASGDVDGRVDEVAARLGIDAAHAHARMVPADKAALVRALGSERVLVIGDGVNDAPAFAEAGCAGTPALDRPQLPARADFVYVGNGVGPLTELFVVARVLRRASLAAITFAIAYNSVVVTLAITGRMTPLLCAIFMPASSLVVVTIVSALMKERALPMKAMEVSPA